MAGRTSAGRGMTLVEITITLAILALAAGLTIPAIGNLTRADLRQSAARVAQKVREAYNQAAISGAVWRLALTPGDPSIRCERSDEDVRLEGGTAVSTREDWRLLAAQDHALVQDSNAQAGLQALFGELPVASDHDEADGEGGQSQVAFQAGEEVQPMRLVGQTRLLDVWTEGLDAPVLEGTVYLYCFPQGYTQAALIHLEDPDRRVMSVKVSPLTGESEVLAGYQEVPH